MKNIHVIPTDRPSRLFYNVGGALLFTNYKNHNGVNIYITNDEEIKDVRPHNGKWQLEKGEILNKFPNYLTDLSECKLVIMTTDPQLIQDGVQPIDDEFLEWFVKNPSCKEVEVKLNSFGECHMGGDYCSCYDTADQSLCTLYYPNYKIIIPKEEPKQETLKQTAVEWLEDKIQSDMTFMEVLGLIRQAKEMEKEQIKDAFDEGQEYEYQYHINSAPKFDSETYYKETFKSE